ncbi:hypothetical protein [Pleomorphovibrio marinus]|uniref:hypothetical protein n=1 Tax=Pleomorphovibrio marinus TaxID=2164132 RepID=UPI000E0A652A|nr:hypothetical protein [Pleomorphovibrio marinus]
MEKKLKKIVFHSSFEEQRLHGQSFSIRWNATKRLNEMYRINKKLYGESYGKISKKTELFVAFPDESVNDFYRRIDKNGRSI